MPKLTIALIGCSKTKARVREVTDMLCPAELYTGDLFKKRLAHVEARGLPWYVMSAKGGLIKPNTPQRHYDHTIDDLDELTRAAWHVGIAAQLIDDLEDDQRLSDLTVELHAGEDYCEPLGSVLRLFGIKVVRPVEGLGIGEQKKYYAISE